MDHRVSRPDWLALVPFGQFVSRQWLLKQGVSPHALDNAVKSGKLKLLARGVLTRPDIGVSWKGALTSLDRLLPDPVYLGGLSALAEAGLGHYIRFTNRFHIYSPARPPTWLARLPLEFELVWHGTARLWDVQGLLSAGSLFGESLNGDLWRMASPEQAYLEVLADVPGRISFEHADELMQGMTSLSPRRLDALLKVCRHVQVKRLFFFFADRYEYPWRKKLDSDDYGLGSGKRSIVPGGKLDRTWQITVPEEFHG